MHDDVESILLERNGQFPNSELPVIVYRGVGEGSATADAVQAMFARNDWPPQWVDTIFDYHHYHSTAHEALGVVSGSARLALGGPGARQVDVRPGDVVIIPAGVAHKLESSSDDFAVVGAYPPGQDWDILKGKDGDLERATANIARLPLPETDPVGGKALLELWREG
ncbi:cupin domain-containing protein [Pelagibacterium sp. 26DY04]|uniref:cupin domain-containing protein n=1 Tax=Pelagibacterium sp. 26DY04 TaxID=2967130 RepID=UPI002814AAB6|nr:cupin domain-containing protein [Pelagibacterium sp. 26DY04]WMT85966.1 cupin domain-containing protein [Pelagibacterium sp. 26DY04]